MKTIQSIWRVAVVACICLVTVMAAGNARHKNAYTHEELVSAYIYLVAKNTRWPDAGRGPFTIGVLEKGHRVAETLKDMTKDFLLHGKPIAIRSFTAIDRVDLKGLNVLFVSREFREALPRLYRSVPDELPLLVISQDAASPEDIMVNIYYDLKHRSRIQVNRKNIERHGLHISDKILLTGGEEVGVSKLFDASLAAMKEQEAKYEKLQRINRKFEKEIGEYRHRIEGLQRDIAAMEKRFETQRKSVEAKERQLRETVARVAREQKKLEEKERQIAKKEKHLARLETEYKTLKQETAQQKRTLMKRIEELEKQEAEIAKRAEILASQQRHIEALDRQIAHQKARIEEQSKIIETHKTLLAEKNVKIEKQTTGLYLLLVIIVLLILFALYIYRNKHLLESLTERLKEAKESAEYANRSKSTFLTNMSHELRTPLNAILGFSDLLLKEERLTPHQKARLEIIHRSGSFLLALINDVLNLARVESGKIVIDKKPVDLGILIRDVVMLMEQRAEVKGLKIEIDQSSRFPRCIVSDGDKIRQILLNYLSNAVKYSDTGTIRLKLDADDERLHMRVSDEGKGIAPEDLEKIFHPFIQVGEASEQTGTGLGLSITKEFAEAMGGKVWAESEPGRGSVFYASIRYEACEGEENDVLKHGGASEVVGLDPAQRNLKVLIVEDKPDNRLLLRSILNVLGVQVREANDGVEAVELFRAWQPDFIWMDRRMPRMNGEEATRRIRSLPGGDDVIIVALTASAFTDEREKVMASGMDDFVVKPYSPDEIYEKMQRYLSLRYIYKDSKKRQESETGKFSPKAYKEALKMVDEKRLDALYEAALLLDVQEVQNVVAAMDDTAPEAARMTRWLADRMEFHEILEAIGAVKEGRKT